jgi:uncharacterized membrane protein
MSKGELWKGVAIRLITAGIFGAIGYFAIYYALQMVAIFGEGMGVDARSREIYAHSHMVVHLFGAACALAGGVFHQAGNKLLRFLAIVAVLTCGGYGILNMVGFTSTNRVSVAATKDATRSSAERSYQSARADLTAQIDWLQKTAAGEEGRERRRLLAEVDAKRKELSALKPPVPTAETILSDPQASTLAELTGTSARRWLLALPIPLAVLLFFAESFSFVVVGHMLAAIVALFAAYLAATQSLSSSPKGGSGEGGESVKSTEESKPKQDANVIPMRATEEKSSSVAASPKVSAEPPRVPAPAPRPPVSLTLKPEYSSVADYLARHPSVTSQKVIADALRVSEAKVSRDIKKLKGQGKVKADRKWRSNQITFTPRRNGGLHAVI